MITQLKWRTQRDSNAQSPASEADALSSCAMGAYTIMRNYIGFTPKSKYELKDICKKIIWVHYFIMLISLWHH